MTGPAYYAVVYLVGGLLATGLMAWRDEHLAVRDAFWLALLWPLTLVVVAWVLAALVLESLGFHLTFGTPRSGVRWGGGLVHLNPDAMPRNFGSKPWGFWLAARGRAVALWWRWP